MEPSPLPSHPVFQPPRSLYFSVEPVAGGHEERAVEATPPDTHFQLRAREGAAAGLRRIAIEQIELAHWHATGALLSDDDVHEIRKACKRIRGVLRLVRDETGPAAYRFENACFRDLARRLSPARSGAVAVETLDGLVRSGVVDLRAVVRLRAALERSAIDLRRSVLEDPTVAADTAAILAGARRRFTRWDPPRPFEPTGVGLERVYRRGRRAMKEAYSRPSPERFHEWRKRVKYLRYQTEILAPAWKGVMGRTARALEHLAEGLGEEHDLAELEATAASSPLSFPAAGDQRTVVESISQRRAEIQRDLRPLGERVYAESPPAFVGRMTSYWSAWRREAGAT